MSKNKKVPPTFFGENERIFVFLHKTIENPHK
uniref:Uncharacterized protein n=1 Tax=viral metagenome TaxID=1070528 RepID=A0A6C0ATP9_9ZZZZ